MPRERWIEWCGCAPPLYVKCEDAWRGMMKQFSLPPSFAVKDIGLTTVVSLTAAQATGASGDESITYDGLLTPEGDETL